MTCTGYENLGIKQRVHKVKDLGDDGVYILLDEGGKSVDSDFYAYDERAAARYKPKQVSR